MLYQPRRGFEGCVNAGQQVLLCVLHMKIQGSNDCRQYGNLLTWRGNVESFTLLEMILQSFCLVWMVRRVVGLNPGGDDTGYRFKIVTWSVCM